MHLRFQGIKKLTTALLAAGLSATLISCSNKDKDKLDEEPVKQPVVKRTAPAPKPPADPTAMFRTPKDDTLPTDAQLAEGADSSIGTGSQPISHPSSTPSTAVKPPKPPEKEDQLDPGE